MDGDLESVLEMRCPRRLQSRRQDPWGYASMLLGKSGEKKGCWTPLNRPRRRPTCFVSRVRPYLGVDVETQLGRPPVWETTANGRGLTTTIQDLDDNRSAAAAGQARSDSPSGEVVWGSVSVSEDLE